MSDDCHHKVRVPRDPEQTMLRRTCQNCGDVVMVSIPSEPPSDRHDERAYSSSRYKRRFGSWTEATEGMDKRED